MDERSKEFRKEILRIVEHARRGHIGSAFSVVEILRVLYEEVLRVNPDDPQWADRDRFILSKGHGCLALYVALAQKGFFPKTELYQFCETDAMLGGHPQYGKVPGVEASTGSLGHGLSIGIGIALNARIDKKDYRTFVLLGDGECNEGSVWEAAMSACKHRLSNLTVLVDYNKMQCFGNTCDVQDLEPFADKWRSFGFNVHEVDGHDVKALQRLLPGISSNGDKPDVIICHTVKGKGVASIERNAAWHHKSKIPDNEMKKLLEELESAG
ncbi:MAG: transketolase [Nitrospirae bacterium GWC2_42_7]|nr:MAG: transketolase [Nitrospirae bacterium GWC2_42_7]